MMIDVRVTKSTKTLYQLDMYHADELIGQYERSIHSHIERKTSEIHQAEEKLLQLFRKHGRLHVQWNGREKRKVVYDSNDNRIGVLFDTSDAASRQSERSKGIDSGSQLMEGALKRVVGSRFERNSRARNACIAHYGTSCAVCGFSFEEAYGEIGRTFIHVHHRVPVSAIGESYEVNPIKDLIPVCPNCHAMIHRTDPPLSVDELKRLIHK